MTPAPETRQYADELLRGIDAKKRRCTVVISTFDIDSHGTRIDQNGWDFSVFVKNPVIPLGHDAQGYTGSNGLPVAKGIPDSIRVEKQRTLMDIEFPEEGVFPLADTVFELVKNGFLNAVSVGFDPLDWDDEDEEDETGESRRVRIYRKQLLLEVSIVTIPSNSNALVQRARKLNRDEDVETFRKLAEKVEELTKDENDPIRWNRSLSRAFDVAGAKLEPSSVENDWISKYLGCEVKKIFQNSFIVPSPEVGSFLSGMRQIASEHILEDVRHLWMNSESPPVYEVIQLNSTQSSDLLVEGTAFYKTDEGNYVVKTCPSWFGLNFTVFTSIDKKEFNRDLVQRAWDWANENNFLKGEAFALSGEFIRKSSDSWENVFLSEKNDKALKRVVSQMNERGKDLPNRGIIMTGPPGTGKTLSGRILRNDAKATFIWISSRDFWRSGAVGGLSYAFQLARRLAPCVLFMEDIDNWLGSEATDSLKTEMDGISRSSGILTVLTTNYPERLPSALIDRPGRFHDVLHFDLPDAKVRSPMVTRWLDGLSEDEIAETVKKTTGYSGAHLYELAQFARTLQDMDGISLADAVQNALRKIEEQKELISSLQLSGSNHRPRRLYGMRLERDAATLSSDMEHKSSTQEIDYKGYFERKQPANRESTKVMERFFKKILQEEQPADEVAAWKRMAEGVEALEEAEEVEEKPEEMEEKPEEKPGEVVEEVVEVETEVEAVIEPPIVVEEPKSEEKPEEIPIASSIPAEEAPQPEQKASVQLSLPALTAFLRIVSDVAGRSAVEALQRGIPVKDVGEEVTVAVGQLTAALLHP